MALDESALRGYISSTLGVDASAIDAADPLFSSSLLDSFSMVDLVVFVEKQCGFRMKPSEVNLDNLDSIERILGFAAKRAQG